MFPVDSRGDEGPQLEGLQLLVAGSFKDGDVDVKVGGNLLVDRVLVLLKTSRDSSFAFALLTAFVDTGETTSV